MRIIIGLICLIYIIGCDNIEQQKKVYDEPEPSLNLSIDSIISIYQDSFNNNGKFNFGELSKKIYIKDSTNPKNAVTYATCLLANKQTIKAKYICHEALAVDSNYSQAYWNIGVAYMMDNNRDSGYYFFNKAISKNQNWYYFFWLSRYFEEDKKYNESLDNINKAISKNQNLIDLKIFRAKYKNNLSDFIGALGDLSNIPYHRKKDPDVFNIYAISYIGLKDFNKAILYCDTGLSIQSNNVYLLYLRALSKTNIDKQEEALLDLKKCAELGSEECKFYYEKLNSSLSNTRRL
ncbi:MAG: hypothetical protein IM600_10840 [Bacteroidetes bacterium]|nr:hypothetical protein [Bacteroidota bacterium]MCA6443915.1 hypothetical protein [Bacteroidota bacterium]